LLVDATVGADDDADESLDVLEEISFDDVVDEGDESNNDEVFRRIFGLLTERAVGALRDIWMGGAVEPRVTLLLLLLLLLFEAFCSIKDRDAGAGGVTNSTWLE